MCVGVARLLSARKLTFHTMSAMGMGIEKVITYTHAAANQRFLLGRGSRAANGTTNEGNTDNSSTFNSLSSSSFEGGSSSCRCSVTRRFRKFAVPTYVILFVVFVIDFGDTLRTS